MSQPRFRIGQTDAAIDYFLEHGYVVFRNAVSSAVCETFWSAVEHHIATNEKLQFSYNGTLYKQRDLPSAVHAAVPRIIDIQGHVPMAAQLMFCNVIWTFLEGVYHCPPTCLQTLTYKFSSEQGPHSDLHLVSPPYVGDYDRQTLIAVWIAFEPARDANGALIIYPGSHRLPKKRLDLDFNNDYGGYSRYLEAFCERHGCRAETYEADAGEMLFWHGDLVHAGGPIRQHSPRPTRRSMVCHYAVVPPRRLSLTPDWVRVDTLKGSYYIPSACVGRS